MESNRFGMVSKQPFSGWQLSMFTSYEGNNYIIFIHHNNDITFITRLHDQSFPSKKVFFDKILWSCKPASTTLSKTLMDFGGIETHPIVLKTSMDFEGNWHIKASFRNQELLFVFEFTGK